MIRMTTVGAIQHLVLPPSVVGSVRLPGRDEFQKQSQKQQPVTGQVGPVFLESEPWLFKVTQSGSAAPPEGGSESEGPVFSE